MTSSTKPSAFKWKPLGAGSNVPAFAVYFVCLLLLITQPVPGPTWVCDQFALVCQHLFLLQSWSSSCFRPPRSLLLPTAGAEAASAVTHSCTNRNLTAECLQFQFFPLDEVCVVDSSAIWGAESRCDTFNAVSSAFLCYSVVFTA